MGEMGVARRWEKHSGKHTWEASPQKGSKAGGRVPLGLSRATPRSEALGC